MSITHNTLLNKRLLCALVISVSLLLGSVGLHSAAQASLTEALIPLPGGSSETEKAPEEEPATPKATPAVEDDEDFITTADKLNAEALNYFKDVSSASAAVSTATTDAAGSKATVLAAESLKWAQLKVEYASVIGETVKNLPKADAPVEFFKSLEELKTLIQKKENELQLATVQVSVFKEKNDSGRAALYEDQVAFLGKLASLLKKAKDNQNKAFEEAYPSSDRQAVIRTTAFERIAEEKAQEIAEIEVKTKELAAKAEEEKKKNVLLAEQAKKELKKASSEEQKDLAGLRLAYAELKIVLKDYEARTLEKELEVKKAEATFQNDRKMLSQTVPQLEKLSPNHKDVVSTITKWTTTSEKLRKEAELLDLETNVLRDEVTTLRSQRDTARQHYDNLDSNLTQNKTNKIYRQRVFYARAVFRLSSAKLDLFRKRIELIEDHRKRLIRHRESYLWGLEKLQKHSEQLYFGQTTHQISWFFLGLLLTYLIALAANTAMNAVFRKMAVKSPWHWDNVAIEELRTPLRLLVIFFGLWTTLKILTLSESQLTLAGKGKLTVEILWLGFIAWRVLNIITRVLKPKFAKTETTLDDQLLAFISRALRAVVILVTSVYFLENFGWKVSSLLAGLGIGGLAFALAAKDTLANLFGSIVLFVDRPFHIGNWVVIGGAEGIVEDIGIRSTRIRTFKDTVVSIPNANVANSPAENIHSFRKRRLFFKLTLRLDTPVDMVEKTVENIRTILTDHPMILDGYYVYVTGIPADGIEIMVYCFVSTRDWGEWLHHSQTVYLSVLRMLEEIKVGLAYSTTTVELENKMPINISGLDEFLKNKNDL